MALSLLIFFKDAGRNIHFVYVFSTSRALALVVIAKISNTHDHEAQWDENSC